MKKKFLCVQGILIIIFLFGNGIGIPCIFHELTGLYCPGCGATRAVLAICRLSFYQAFRYNMIITLLLPCFILFGLYKYAFNGKKKVPKIIWYLLLTIILLYGILRNIPIFDFLIPTKI